VVEDDLYRIGTVARLTGISVECLRAWERRYGLAPAERSGRTRFYSQAQLARLKKIKSLLDAGHPISSLVELTDAQLDSRVQTRGETHATLPAHRLPQVGLIGPNLVLLEQESGDTDAVEVSQRWVSIEDFCDARERERGGLDVVVLQLPTLDFSDLDRARRFASDCRWIVVYRYATREAVTALRERGIQALTWPVVWDDLVRACATPAGVPARAGRTAPRRYSDHELVAIASRARQYNRDAPRELVALITDLNAFTDFAAQRVVSDSPEAEVYERLREDASYARAQLERALAFATERG
jgi:DNA-binding transcriptional MerR regulator